MTQIRFSVPWKEKKFLPTTKLSRLAQRRVGFVHKNLNVNASPIFVQASFATTGQALLP